MLKLQVITRDNDILGGIPIFVGTRVPVQTLFDYLEAGHPLDEFLADFPTVQRSQAQTLLRSLKQILLAGSYESFA